jgi:hypothetical protein
MNRCSTIDLTLAPSGPVSPQRLGFQRLADAGWKPWFGSGCPRHLRFRFIPATRATDVPGFTAGTSPANRIPQVFKELESLYRRKAGAAIPLSPQGDSPLAA